MSPSNRWQPGQTVRAASRAAALGRRRPRPVRAEEPEAEPPRPYAGPVLRLAGFFVDEAVAALPLIPALALAAVREARVRDGIGGFFQAYVWASVALAVYFWVGHAVWGLTLGKWLVGIQVVRQDGTVPGWWRSAVRAIVSNVAGSLPLFGLVDPAWLLWDKRRQTLHDKAAGTFVVARRPRHALKMLGLSIVLMVAGQVGLTFAALRPFILQTYWVPTGSMRDTLVEKDRLAANKLAYHNGRLHRQDIIVFRAPPWADPERKDYIKRLIGLPGDTIEVRDGRVFVNGRTIEEPYVREPPRYGWGPVKVPEGSVVVLGDNRNNSHDSHAWRQAGKPAPFVPIEDIYGRAIFRFWPLQRWGDLPPGLERPDLDAARARLAPGPSE